MPELILSHSTYDECSKELFAFRNANRETERDMGYLDWRYKKRPSKTGPVIVWARTGAGEPVGSISIVPHSYYSDGRRTTAGILGDISVSRQWRNKGVARQMLCYLPEVGIIQKLDFCLVLPNEPAAKPLEKSGWKEISRLERYVKILDSGAFLKRRIKNRPLASVLSPALSLFLKSTSYETYHDNDPGYKTEVLREPDGRFDALWDEVGKAHSIIGERTREYLHWRYAMHPLIEHGFFCLSAGERLAGYSVFHYNDGACYIDDLLARSEKDAVYLLLNLIEHVKKTSDSAEMILKIRQSRFNGRIFKRFGFSKRADYLKFMVYSPKAAALEKITGLDCYLTGYDKDV